MGGAEFQDFQAITTNTESIFLDLVLRPESLQKLLLLKASKPCKYYLPSTT